MDELKRVRTVKAGAVLFHGTAVPLDEFDERHDSLERASFLSDSEQVAKFFAGRSLHANAGGIARVVSFRLPEPVELPLIESRYEMDDFCEKHGIELGGVEEMRDGILDSGQPGWFVAGNYPCGGADILLAYPGSLEYVESAALTSEGQLLLEEMRLALDGEFEPGMQGCEP